MTVWRRLPNRIPPQRSLKCWTVGRRVDHRCSVAPQPWNSNAGQWRLPYPFASNGFRYCPV